MTRTNNLNTKEMTQNEIKEALANFKKCLKMGLFTYEHADPLKEYCFISSSDIMGLYFPNSEIKTQAKMGFSPCWYDFIALAKVGDALGFVVSFNEENAPDAIKRFEVNEDIFVSFNEVLFSPEERRTIEEIEARINDLKSDLKVINNIKYITKKDGKPFKDIFKNIDPQPEANKRITYWADSWGYYRISLSEEMTSKNGVKYNNYYRLDVYNPESLEDLQNTLSRFKEQKEQHIKEYQNDIKNIKKIFEKAQEFKNFLSNTTYTTREAVKKYL